jgi:ribosome biogenesis GTPase
MVVGTVLRSHAGGYLVHSDELGMTLQCAARGRIKKERKSIVTGDEVEIDEVDAAGKSAVIVTRKDRTTLLSRPLIANVNQAVIVQAAHQPEWNPLICDRYLVHCQLELPDAQPVLCINKCDLASEEEVANLREIYKTLGYKIVFVSAVNGEGVDEMIELLKGKISVLAGPSGVGKSSLINYLDPGLHLRVGVMDHDFGTGRHTTTYSEIYKIKFHLEESAQSSWVADTPGFSMQELRHPDPHDVYWQFPEIAALAPECKYSSNCLHLVEQGCRVLEKLDTIAPTRYESYVTIVTESLDEEKARKETSQKVESHVKVVGGKEKGKIIPKLSSKYRAASRRTEKQQILTDEDEGEEEQLDDESSSDDDTNQS